MIENKNEEISTSELNSLALEEVQHSFGYKKNDAELKNSNDEGEYIFRFETSEVNNEIGNEGPSKTFPKIRSDKETDSNEQIEERDAKEIEIERRLKESSELLKKAKQPLSRTKRKKGKRFKGSQNLGTNINIIYIRSFYL